MEPEIIPERSFELEKIYSCSPSYVARYKAALILGIPTSQICLELAKWAADLKKRSEETRKVTHTEESTSGRWITHTHSKEGNYYTFGEDWSEEVWIPDYYTTTTDIELTEGARWASEELEQLKLIVGDKQGRRVISKVLGEPEYSFLQTELERGTALEETELRVLHECDEVSREVRLKAAHFLGFDKQSAIHTEIDRTLRHSFDSGLCNQDDVEFLQSQRALNELLVVYFCRKIPRAIRFTAGSALGYKSLEMCLAEINCCPDCINNFTVHELQDLWQNSALIHPIMVRAIGRRLKYSWLRVFFRNHLGQFLLLLLAFLFGGGAVALILQVF